MKIDMHGQRALVCGASRGIGRATAIGLAEAGAEIIAAARDEQRLRELVAALPGSPERRHIPLAVDFCDGEALREALSDAVGGGPIQVVVNNSGGPPAGPACDAAPEDFESAFRQHLVADQMILQALVPGMKEAGYGRIVNIISTSVKEPIPGLGVSNTIRGAVASWAKTLARELGPFGITVNNVLPGFTATERLDYIFRQRAEVAGQSYEAIRDQALALVPAGRFAAPEEIAAAIVFLASPAAAYINGVNLPVDGGRTGSL
jgi:3-oxoacyl-[acyl-carrier protein] reductase